MTAHFGSCVFDPASTTCIVDSFCGQALHTGHQAYVYLRALGIAPPPFYERD